MAIDLKGRVALVTGSTSGIGLEVAHKLADKGCNLVVTGLGDKDENQAIADEIASKYGVKAVFIGGDLLVKEQLQGLVDDIFKLYPDGIDILINNAGFNHVAPVEEYPDERWDAMVGIHLSAAFHLTKRFVPAMKKKRWGRIVNMSSQMGVISFPGKAVYSAMKSALIGLAKGVALEVAEYGITCNAVCPTYARSALFDVQMEKKAKADGTTFQEALDDTMSTVPVKMPVTISQIADMIMYLISSEASPMLTGAHYLIDGGFTAQ